VHAFTSWRYAGLIDELGKAMGYERGWKSKAAQQLGITRRLLILISRGEPVLVTRSMQERAIQGCGLPPDYFVQKWQSPSLAVGADEAWRLYALGLVSGLALDIVRVPEGARHALVDGVAILSERWGHPQISQAVASLHAKDQGLGALVIKDDEEDTHDGDEL
jgi:hypothetical protein